MRDPGQLILEQVLIGKDVPLRNDSITMLSVAGYAFSQLDLGSSCQRYCQAWEARRATRIHAALDRFSPPAKRRT
jgi:hypothetical protein